MQSIYILDMKKYLREQVKSALRKWKIWWLRVKNKKKPLKLIKGFAMTIKMRGYKYKTLLFSK